MARNVKIKIVDKGWEKYLKAIPSLRNSYTRVGFPAGEDPAPGDKTFDQVVQVAAVHEFGAPKVNIPERSFLRSTFDEQREPINQALEKVYEQVAAGQRTTRQAFSRVGEWFKGKVQNKIRDLKSPALATETIKRKGSANPLVDTGQMMQSVTHVEHISHG